MGRLGGKRRFAGRDEVGPEELGWARVSPTDDATTDERLAGDVDCGHLEGAGGEPWPYTRMRAPWDGATALRRPHADDALVVLAHGSGANSG